MISDINYYVHSAICHDPLFIRRKHFFNKRKQQILQNILTLQDYINSDVHSNFEYASALYCVAHYERVNTDL